MRSSNPTADHAPDVASLSRRSFWLVTAMSVVLFLVIDNPLFGDPYDIDASIILSYVAILPMTAALLWIERKLSVFSWLLESLAVVCAKFGITLAIAVVMWVIVGPAQSHADVIPQAAATTTASMLERPDTLDDRVAVVLSPQATGTLEQAMVTVFAGQPVVLRSPDDRLHTALATGPDGRTIFNVPVVPGSTTRVHTFDTPGDTIDIRCTVHDEAESYPLIRVADPR